MFFFTTPKPSPIPADRRRRNFVIVSLPAPLCGKKDDDDEEDDDDDAEAIQQRFQNLLNQKSGDVNALAFQLFQEQHKARVQRRKLRREIKDLEEKQPKEGSIVLSGDDAKIYAELTKDRKLVDVQKLLNDGATQAQELSDLKFRSLVGDAATAHGLKPSVLQELAKSRSLVLEMGETEFEVDKGGGKKEKGRKPAAFVVDAQDPKKKTNLDDYLKTSAADFLPALQATKADGAGDEGAKKSWVRTGGGAAPQGGGGGSLLEKAKGQMAQAADAPSVLNPAPANAGNTTAKV